MADEYFRELQYWLRMEQEALRISSEMRIKEATAIVDAYAAGQLTDEQVKVKQDEYHSRWPDVAKGEPTQTIIDDAIHDAIEGPPSRSWAEIHKEQDKRWEALKERVRREPGERVPQR